jgi:hypothetical protein
MARKIGRRSTPPPALAKRPDLIDAILEAGSAAGYLLDPYGRYGGPTPSRFCHRSGQQGRLLRKLSPEEGMQLGLQKYCGFLQATQPRLYYSLLMKMLDCELAEWKALSQERR